MLEKMKQLKQNILDLPGSLVISAWIAGFIAVLISYTGPLVVVFQAANNAGLSLLYASSWIWAITVGSGIACIFLCLWYRQPVIAAWSTPGAALLVTALAHYRFSAAIGAYLVAGLVVTLIGISRLFGKIMAWVPQPVVMGMLAGILVKFGFDLFSALPERLIMVGVMILSFFLLKRVAFRAPTLGALLLGLLIAFFSRDVHFAHFSLALTIPQLIRPEFQPDAIIGLGLPLIVLALTSQNAPGIAVLRASGYDTPVDGPILITGILSLLTAPFGGPGLNLAALTAAICTNPEAHPDPNRRYAAGVAAGIWYIIFGIFGATAIALFAAFPSALVAAVAGLALSDALISSLSGSMAEKEGREAAIVAFLCTASNITLLGIGSPFWGLIFGSIISLLLRRRIFKKKQSIPTGDLSTISLTPVPEAVTEEEVPEFGSVARGD